MVSETCMICNKEKKSSTLSTNVCKMCGMGVENVSKSMGFVFCCNKCAKHFEEMYESLDPAGKRVLSGSSVVF